MSFYIPFVSRGAPAGDGQGTQELVLKGRLAPCECEVERCERSLYCFVEERVKVQEHYKSVVSLHEKAVAAVRECEKVMQAWYRRAESCREIRELLLVATQRSQRTKQTSVTWTQTSTCEQFVETHLELEQRINEVFVSVSDFALHARQMRGLVQILELPVQVTRPDNGNVDHSKSKPTLDAAATDATNSGSLAAPMSQTEGSPAN